MSTSGGQVFKHTSQERTFPIPTTTFYSSRRENIPKHELSPSPLMLFMSAPSRQAPSEYMITRSLLILLTFSSQILLFRKDKTQLHRYLPLYVPEPLHLLFSPFEMLVLLHVLSNLLSLYSSQPWCLITAVEN